jgi:hypothetical protein
MNKSFRYTYLGEANHRRAGSLGAAFIDWLMAQTNKTAFAAQIKEAGHDLKHLRWDLHNNPKLFLIVDDLTGKITAGPDGSEPNLAGLETSEGEVGRWRQTDEGPVWETATEQEAAAFLAMMAAPEQPKAEAAPVAEEEVTTIDDINGMLSEIAGLAADIKSNLEEVRDEEQEYYDNMPESFQNGEKGSMAQEEIDAMEEAISQLEEVENVAD